MADVFTIGSTDISDNCYPYVIAEIGVNHDGSLERGLELISEAAHAGADAIKFQWFTAESLVSRGALTAEYQNKQGIKDQYDLLNRLELSSSEMSVLLTKVHELGLHGIVTVFSDQLVDDAAGLDWDAWKTASPDLVHRPLIDRLIHDGRPLIISTGGSTLQEIERADDWLGSHPAAFLQCVSAYPTENDQASLAGIGAITSVTDRICGYSDHTLSEHMGGLAVTAGANILEKHFTYSRTAVGPDHSSSIDRAGLQRYISFAREAHEAMGVHSEKSLLDIEKDVRRVARQSIRAARPIPKGKIIERDDLVIKRPGDGIEPWRLNQLVGSKVVRNFVLNQAFEEGDWQ